jgi:rhodanese-related sulfurtransferase
LRNPYDDVPQIDSRAAYDLLHKGEVNFLDVREQSEWDLGHVDGISFIPLGQLPWRWRELDPDKSWICVCLSGSRSNYAAALLRQAGLEAANLEGGMLDWQANGLPITDPGIVQTH